MSEAQSGVGGDAALAECNFVDAARRNTNVHREPVLAHVEWLQKFFHQNFAGVNGFELCHVRNPHAANRCLEVKALRNSCRVAPAAMSARTIRSSETDGSPASILATRDWLDPKR